MKISMFDTRGNLFSETDMDLTVAKRWLSRDPLEGKFPSESAYNSFGDNPILYIDPDGREKIVVVGNQGDSPNSDLSSDGSNGGYRKGAGQHTRHFLQAGLDRARKKKNEAEEWSKRKSERTGVEVPVEQVSLIIKTGGYTDKEIEKYKNAAKKDGINIILMSDALAIENYIITKNKSFSNTDPTNRGKDVITDFTYFGHAGPDAMMLGYDDDYDSFGSENFTKDSFDRNARIFINGCGSATGSMYKGFLKVTSGWVIGYMVTVEWGKGGVLGKYYGWHEEYALPDIRDEQEDTYVAPEKRRKKQKGTR